MKLNELQKLDFSPTDIDLINFFDVEEREKTSGVDTFFNLNESVQIDLGDYVSSYLKTTHIVKSGENLKLISYKYYQSVSYWWILAKVNHIEDVFSDLKVGQKIYILSADFINRIYQEIMSIKRNGNR